MIVTHSSLSWRYLALTIGLCAGLVAQPVVASAATVGMDATVACTSSAEATPDVASATATEPEPTKLEGLAYQYQEGVFTLKPDESNVITEKFIDQLKEEFVDSLKASNLAVRELVFEEDPTAVETEQKLIATKATYEALLDLFPDAEVKDQDKDPVVINDDQPGETAEVQAADDTDAVVASQATNSATAAPTASLPALRSARAMPAAMLGTLPGTNYPDYRGLFWKSDRNWKMNDIGFVNFSASFDNPLLRSDGYVYNSHDYRAFPGAKGNYAVVPYRFIGGFHDNKGKVTPSPLYAFFVVLPKTLTTTDTEAQAAATAYYRALHEVYPEAKNFTGLTAEYQGETDGRQVWLFTPSAGATYGPRGLDAAQIPKAPTMDIPVHVDPDFADSNEEILANPQSKVPNDDGLNQSTIFAIIPLQADAGIGNATIGFDYLFGGGKSADLPFQYFGDTPDWAKSVIDKMNAKMDNRKMVVATYDGGNGANWAYRFQAFDNQITDTYKVVDTNGQDLNIPITKRYEMRVDDRGQYVGSYQLTADSFKAIRDKGYQPVTITIGTEHRDNTKLQTAIEAVTAGKEGAYNLYKEVWQPAAQAELWQASQVGADFAGIDVKYELPIDTTKQWYTTKAKAASLQKRQGVITVKKIESAPLTINVVDYRNQPLTGVDVEVKNASGHIVTTNKAGEQLKLTTDENGQIKLTNMPYDTYTVTQTHQYEDLIKPGSETRKLNTPEGNSVTLVNEYDSIPTDLPATGSRDGLYALVGLVTGLMALTITIMKWPLKKSSK